MNAIRKFLLRSTLLRPSVLLPLVGGAIAGLASWSLGGSVVLTSLAIAGLGGGTLWMIARAVMNVEGLTDQALAAERQAKRDAEDRELDQLARQLRTDRDHRTQDALRLLRDLRNDFERAAQRPGGELLSARIAEQISQIFDSAVSQLRESYRLMQRAESVVGEAHDQLLEQRDSIVKEAVATTERLSAVVNQYQKMRPDSQESQMNLIKEELDANLEIARRTEERMKELENPVGAHESYLKE